MGRRSTPPSTASPPNSAASPSCSASASAPPTSRSPALRRAWSSRPSTRSRCRSPTCCRTTSRTLCGGSARTPRAPTRSSSFASSVTRQQALDPALEARAGLVGVDALEVLALCAQPLLHRPLERVDELRAGGEQRLVLAPADLVDERAVQRPHGRAARLAGEQRHLAMHG